MSGERVLIVEDEALIALNLAAIVEDLGYEVVGPVASLRQALAAAAAVPTLEIALVDVNLVDGPTGPVIAEHLASRHHTCVVMVTANPEGLVAGAGGVQDIVRKPYYDEGIAEVLRRVSARRAEADGRRARSQHPVVVRADGSA